MKKNFITPTINIDLFMTENVITTSGTGKSAYEKATGSFGTGVQVFDGKASS